MAEYGLIFDMDGVLGDTEPPCAEAGIITFRDLYGTEVKVEDFAPFIGTGAVRYLEGPAEKLGIKINTAHAVAYATERFIELLQDAEDISFPGIHTLIDMVAGEEEWKLAIATSSPENKARPTLAAARIDLEKFQAFINGDMVEKKKPHPEIYLTAAQALGFPPTACIVVEDAVEGIKAAKAAGMFCIGVTNSFPAEHLREADLVVDSATHITMDVLQSLLPA
nr:beta-phosphoglucomutase [uncultured bacterium]